MKKLALAVALFAVPAYAATAYWTGESRYVTTVTGRAAVSCKYSYFGNYFWRTFTGGTCPSSVEVE